MAFPREQIAMFKWMEENLHQFEGIEFEVREVYIMSRVGPDPSKYEVRHTIPLGQPAQQLPPYFPEIPLPDSYHSPTLPSHPLLTNQPLAVVLVRM